MTFLVNTSFRRVALAAGLAFLVALAVLTRARRRSGRASRPVCRSGQRPALVGEHRRRDPPPAGRGPALARRATAPRVALAGEYLQRVRETGDAAFYARAETLLRGVLARDPDNADALVALGGLALSRHDFRGGLALARRADAGLSALPVEVDALVELGRYGEARRTLQRLADLKPNLSTYARVSYLRELHGDLRGAASALSPGLRGRRAGAGERGGDRRPARRPGARARRARARPARRTPAPWRRADAMRRRRPGERGWPRTRAGSRPPSGATARSSRGCRCPST